jgi:hypothetical protein
MQLFAKWAANRDFRRRSYRRLAGSEVAAGNRMFTMLRE